MTNSQPPKERGPGVSAMLTLIRRFEFAVVCALIVLMLVVVGLSVVELAATVYTQILSQPRLMINLPELLSLLGLFMMVLIGLELLETIKNYLTDNLLHVEVVLLVAVIAVARKVIILDLSHMEPHTLIGIAVLVAGLAVSYRLIKYPPSRGTPNT